MKIALRLLSEYILKVAGAAVAESMALSAHIREQWDPSVFLSNMLSQGIDFEEGSVSGRGINRVLKAHSSALGDEFITSVATPVFDNYVEESFVQGIYGALAKADTNIVDTLSQLTGSTKVNTRRTINRWFKNTQGKYFERFIIPETHRVAELLKGKHTQSTLNKIGRRYKKFVKADAYWNSIATLNTETAAVFGQLDSLSELGHSTYKIQALIDKLTCTVCIHMNGSTWSVSAAQRNMGGMLALEADEMKDNYPWPRPKDISKYPEPGESPFSLPPYHGNCRCRVVAAPTPGEKITAGQRHSFRRRPQGRLQGTTNDRLSKYMSACYRTGKGDMYDYRVVVMKILDKKCLDQIMFKAEDMQLGFEGEDLVRDLLDMHGSTHKSPFDFYVPEGHVKGNKIGLEIRTRRSTGREFKCALNKNAKARKMKWLKQNPGSDDWMLMIIRDSTGNCDLYLKQGIGSYRHTGMNWIGQVQRTKMGKAGKTIIDPEVRENFLKVLQGKAPGLTHGNLTPADIEKYRKKYKLGDRVSSKRLGKYMSACTGRGKDAGMCELDLKDKIFNLQAPQDATETFSKIAGVQPAKNMPLDGIIDSTQDILSKKGWGLQIHYVKKGAPLRVSPKPGAGFKACQKHKLNPAMVVMQDNGSGSYNVYVKQKFKWTGESDLIFVGRSDVIDMSISPFKMPEIIDNALSGRPFSPLGKPVGARPKTTGKPKPPPAYKNIPKKKPTPAAAYVEEPVDTVVPKTGPAARVKATPGKMKWQDCKNHQEVARQLKINLRRIGWGNVDIAMPEGFISLAGANKAGEALTEMMNNYGGLRRKMRALTAQKLGTTNAPIVSVINHPTRNYWTMRINGDEFADEALTGLSEFFKKAAKVNYTPMRTPLDIFTHEFGHGLHHNLRHSYTWKDFGGLPKKFQGLADNSTPWETFKSIRETIAIAGHHGVKTTKCKWLRGILDEKSSNWHIEKSIGRYATASQEETFAEGFFMYHRRKKETPRWLKEFFEAIDLDKSFKPVL